MNTIFKSFIVLTIVLLAVVPAFATGPGFNTGVDDGCPPPLDIPLDGGMSLLAAAGVGYGIKKFRDMRKKESTQA